MTAATVITCCSISIFFTLLLVKIPGLQSAQSGNAGQAFGAVTGATSMVVLIYIARTFSYQREETQMQREMLEAQRAELISQREQSLITNECAQKVAEAAVRGQHNALISAAISDPLLADVWPSYGQDTPTETRKKFLYANEIISLQCMSYTLGYLTSDQAEATMYHLFESATLRSFWEQTRVARMESTPHGGQMWKFYELTEEAYRHRLES
ncbi:DUF6082 family protein [Streptomyces prunicolor]|uniref:DUF6082 family protein n=1 Tax=Streptomyces prunicolor TaxID=67348 RepID=UPI0037D8AC0B